ncbi:MAG: hypothetical protein IM586_12520 [Pseudanabaena sp. M172S2SP2A07QC]|jgi:hypothetical protein|nr:hypothetical protein [Pseudanabaena sp. M172S2SP2A07QC]MCA6510285.1 hypothetical protein [Pseudanabaena sp. M109S1SP2A07QC]MCA6546665.1 hypothetical protein [Pseudanabaena sp. M152S2SP2A07QC]
MFDELVEVCNELTAAYQAEVEIENQLKDQKAKIDALKTQLRTASNVTTIYPKAFEQTLYSYKGEIYLIQYSQSTGNVIAEKINFFKAPQV